MSSHALHPDVCSQAIRNCPKQGQGLTALRDDRRANKEIEFRLHDGFSSIRVNAWSKYSQVIT
jgi:hypothetical protein